MRSHLVCLSCLLAFGSASAVAADDIFVASHKWYSDTDFHKAYSDKYGASPKLYENDDDQETLKQALGGQKFDVAQICDGSLPEWLEAGILEPWDTSRIDAFKDLDPRFLMFGSSGDLYLLPFEYGPILTVYKPDQVPVSAATSLEVFRNPAYSGKIAIPKTVDDVMPLALLAIGVTNFSTASIVQVDAALEWLQEVHQNDPYYYDDVDELTRRMAVGDIFISWTWPEVAQYVTEMGQTVAMQNQVVDTVSVWTCGLVKFSNGNGDDDRVYDYVNSYFDEAAIKKLLSWSSLSPNLAVMQAQTVPEDLKSLVIPSGEGSVIKRSQVPIDVRQHFIDGFRNILRS